jgi:hypothetical protein
MNNYINVIRNFLKSITSFRVRNEREIYSLKNRFLTPGVVRNDGKKILLSFRERNEREISHLRDRFLTPAVVRNDSKKLLLSFLTKSKPYLLLLLCLCISSIAMSQPPDTGGDVDVPIDGGLTLLIAAGAGYGAKQLRKKKVDK